MVAAAVAIVAAAAMLAVVFVPIQVELDCDTHRAPSLRPMQVRVRWWVFTWRSGAERRPSVAQRRSRPAAVDPSYRRRVLGALASPRFAARVHRLVVELLPVLVPRTAHGLVRFGFDDPASTGVVFGVAQACSRSFRPVGWQLEMQPEFTESTLVASARIEWSIRPASLLWPLSTFIASPVTWRTGARLMIPSRFRQRGQFHADRDFSHVAPVTTGSTAAD